MKQLPLKIVDVKNASCILGNKNILRNISWSVSPGEHWAVIGLNGSGKTSLLKMLTGYLSPSSGTMQVLGKTYGAYDWRRLRRKIGLVSSALQEEFYADETAEEIVLSGLFSTIGLYDTVRRRDSARAQALLRKLDCINIAKQYHGVLSQGEKQKVLIARALIGSPQLLILDEPCSGLDMIAREHLLASIEKLGRGRSAPTCIYVSHHIEEIVPTITHVLLLRRGRVHSSGVMKKILTSANLSSFFERSVKVRWRNGRAWVDLDV